MFVWINMDTWYARPLQMCIQPRRDTSFILKCCRDEPHMGISVVTYVLVWITVIE